MAPLVSTIEVTRPQADVYAYVTSIDSPETWSVHGIDGPIRAIVNVAVERLDATRSRVTIELDFEGHGIGKLLVPLVVRRAETTLM
jgi:hypothetical protein